MKHGDLITIVLKHPANVKEDGRLIHTSVFVWHHHRKPVAFWTEIRDTFEACDDDRIVHAVADLGVTYLLGHVPKDSPEALELVRCAEEADRLTEQKEG